MIWRTITKLYDLGFHFEITPSIIVIGKISTLGIKLIGNYTLPVGKLEINISIKENS